MKRVKRREFLQAALAGMAALTLVPVPAKAVPFSEVFQPAGDWAEITHDACLKGCNTVTTLDGIFKRVYGGKLKSCYPTPFGFTPSFDSDQSPFSQPIILKQENGFTEAR
jgi:hypothetical protein